MHTQGWWDDFTSPVSLETIESLDSSIQLSFDRGLIAKHPVERLGIRNGVSSEGRFPHVKIPQDTSADQSVSGSRSQSSTYLSERMS